MIVGLGALSGCGTMAENADVGIVHIGGVPKVADTAAVQIVETGPPLGAATKAVIGTSCKNKLWDPPASADNAIALMKRQAESLGFNAIHSMRTVLDPTAITKNCWEAVIATGIAFKMDAPTEGN